MMHQTKHYPSSWLAFDLNVLRRLKFESVSMPFTPDPVLGTYLKRYQIRVAANDLLRSAWTAAVASIQNNAEKLTDDDVNLLLEDVYVPGHRLANPALRNWFGETDAWWFDNVRRNLDRLRSPFAFAIGSSIAMAVGDYVHSFTDETRELRQPLSNVYRRIWMSLPEPVNNGQNNVCHNKPISEFIAESPADLLFLRLPAPISGNRTGYPTRAVWREEWLRGEGDFWPGLDTIRNGTLGMTVQTKSQYLQLLQETLGRAGNFKKWAIAHVESGLVSTQDIVTAIAAVNRNRPVEAIYTKDFSELTGSKAVIVTA